MTDPLEGVWRAERAAIVGALARRFRDLGLAEDAVQEAFAAAATRWPVDGVPNRPGAWLTTTAHRKALGMLRKRTPVPTDSFTDVPAVESDDATSDGLDPRVMDDDLFTLLLTCCHPALARESRIALTLRHVCGLSTEQIASGLLVGGDAMTKRLVRDRRKIRDAGITFESPSGVDLDERLDDVRSIIYLVFNEGYLASHDGPAVRHELCSEAIWLARQLHRLRPDDETMGLLALMLLHDARRTTRQDGAGRLVPLLEQRRDGWDHGAIDEARSLIAGGARTELGPYQVEAAIALLHVSSDPPDWIGIADLYGVLARMTGSPVVEVNRALAVGRADGPSAGLAVLEPVLNAGELDGYAPLHAGHAELLDGAGKELAAAQAWHRAASCAANPAQRAALAERAAPQP